MKPQVGLTTKTGFVLVEKIETITRLSEAIENEISIYWRYRMIPTAFVRSWQYNHLNNEIKKGVFFIARKEDNP
jgi:hypothetical protein